MTVGCRSKMDGVGRNTTTKMDGGRRITVNLSAIHTAIVDSARPPGGSLSDAMRTVIDLALKADVIERQNRELTGALTAAMGEMTASLVEIRQQIARLERRQ